MAGLTLELLGSSDLHLDHLTWFALVDCISELKAQFVFSEHDDTLDLCAVYEAIGVIVIDDFVLCLCLKVL